MARSISPFLNHELRSGGRPPCGHLQLRKEERECFPQICPDFIIEFRLTSDHIEHLKEKLEEYIENGAQLGWLIDPIQKKVYVYRPNAGVEELDNSTSISGDPLLKGFVLDLKN
jgi:Uma2 family endonuclease